GFDVTNHVSARIPKRKRLVATYRDTVMNQRAVIPSGARDLAQGDKSLKLKSVIIGKREVLRSAQNDRAHQHGLRASRFALSRRWTDRVSLFIGGSCRCVGLQ